jgi:hypothetical protein
MRERADADRLRRFMRALGQHSSQECRVYLTGGATAVLEGWRRDTIDADILIVPDSDAVLRAIPDLKESLHINVELASPADFIPELPGWQDRSRFIERCGKVSFHHYDFYAQALAKTERGEVKDVGDVQEMVARGLVEPVKIWRFFRQIEPMLYKYPDLDPGEFARSIIATVGPEPTAP